MKKIFSFLLALLLFGAAILSAVGFSRRSPLCLHAEVEDFNCKAYVLIDAISGEVLTQKDSEKHFEIASMVKLMTSLIAMEKIEKNELDLSNKVVISENAASQEGSQAFLDAHAEYSVEELLKSVIIASANDSSVALAELIGGNEYNFVNLMNERAQELGLKNTLYANSTGLPALNQYSTAFDVACLLKEVNKHDIYKKYATIWMDKLVHPSGRETELVNTNRLIKYFPGCECGKTGYTDEAGYCLSAVAKRNDMKLIAVTMGCENAQDRFTITSNLLNYGFGNYLVKTFIKQNEEIEFAQKIKGIKEKVLMKPEREVTSLTKKVGAEDIEVKLIYNKISNNILKGDVLAKALVIKKGVVVDEVNLCAVKDYELSGFGYYFKNIVKHFNS